MTDLIVKTETLPLTTTTTLDVNSLMNEQTSSTSTSTATPPSSTEEDSDENDHPMQTSSFDEPNEKIQQNNDQNINESNPTLSIECSTKSKLEPTPTSTEPEQLFPSPAAETDLEHERMDTSQSSTDSLRAKFEHKFKLLLQANSASPLSFLTNNVWILNQIIMPSVGSATSSLQCGSLKIRFSYFENDASAYQNHKKENLELPDTLTSKCDYLSADIESDSTIQFKNGQIIQRNHVHTLFASNFSGQYSLPLVLYSNDLESNTFHSHNLTKTIFIAKTSNGDLNDLNLFVSWLKLFILQQQEMENLEPKCLLINSYLYTLLFRSNISPNSVKLELINLLKENQIYLLFYPIEDTQDAFNRHIFNQFKENWKQIIIKYASKNNPNGLLGFVNVFKQTVRELFAVRNKRGAAQLQATYNDFVSNFKNLINSELNSQMLSHLTSLLNHSNETNGVELKDDEATQTSDETEVTSTATHAATNVQLQPIPKHTEQEMNEFTDWINEMTKLGCLCIKYTYLRDLQMKYRPKQVSTSKELIASDNKWSELMRKIQSKLDYPNENEYISKWFDVNYWRQAYYKLIREELNVTEPDSIWTFDLIQFPYMKDVVHAPENDYSRRPKNFKSKISVIFAFNAAGDNLESYCVYPTQFQKENEVNTNETFCFSHNGYVTSRSFEHWLTNSFIPYLNQKNLKQTVLLYCGKLAVLDMNNLNLCKQNNIKPFCIPDEKIKPFSLLFQKSARKRQTDLFLDSWKKVTSKSGMSYQFKCSSRQEFYNLYLNAFQNCIEETSNLNESFNNEDMSTSLNGSQSTAAYFKNKMISSFEQCQLWPIKDEDYKEFFESNGDSNRFITNTNNEAIIQPTPTLVTPVVSIVPVTASAASPVLPPPPPQQTSTETVIKKRGRKKSTPHNESANLTAETSQLNEETTNKTVTNLDEKQSDLDEKNENDSDREEPLNKRRKLSLNGKKKESSYADALVQDSSFQHAIENLIAQSIRTSATFSQKLTIDLIGYIFETKVFNKTLSLNELKRKLKEKLDAAQNTDDLIRNFFNAIKNDSDIFVSSSSSLSSTSSSSSDESNFTPASSNSNTMMIQEIFNQINSVYANQTV